MLKSRYGLGLAALAVTALVGSTVAVAFPGGQHRGHHPERKIEKMLDAVDATDAQRQAIRDALAAQKPDREILRERHRELRSQMKSLDPLAGDYLERVNAIAEQKGALSADRFRVHALLKQQIATHLTQSQRDKLAELKAQRRDRMKQKWRERHAE